MADEPVKVLATQDFIIKMSDDPAIAWGTAWTQPGGYTDGSDSGFLDALGFSASTVVDDFVIDGNPNWAISRLSATETLRETVDLRARQRWNRKRRRR
jgi:hypothetical protein